MIDMTETEKIENTGEIEVIHQEIGNTREIEAILHKEIENTIEIKAILQKTEDH